MNIKDLATSSHFNAVAHGFWDEDKPNIPEKLCLVHSEISEALEEYRSGKMDTTINVNSGKPEGLPSELADIIIRVLDLSEYLGINMERELMKKHEYNKTRPHKHDKVC